MPLTLESLSALLKDACSKHIGTFKGQHEHTTHGKRQYKDLAVVIESFRKSVEEGLQKVTAKRNSSSANASDIEDTDMQEMEPVNHALASEVASLDDRADKLAAVVKEKRNTVPAWIEEQMNAGVRALGDATGDATTITKDANGDDVEADVARVDGTRMQTLCQQFVEIGSRLDTLAEVLPKTARDLSDARDTAEKLLHQDESTENSVESSNNDSNSNKSDDVGEKASDDSYSSIQNEKADNTTDTASAVCAKRNGKTMLAKRLARKLATQTTKRQCLSEAENESSNA